MLRAWQLRIDFVFLLRSIRSLSFSNGSILIAQQRKCCRILVCGTWTSAIRHQANYPCVYLFVLFFLAPIEIMSYYYRSDERWTINDFNTGTFYGGNCTAEKFEAHNYLVTNARVQINFREKRSIFKSSTKPSATNLSRSHSSKCAALLAIPFLHYCLPVFPKNEASRTAINNT